MRKDEKYIKKLLSKIFEGKGNFQRFEFCYYSRSARPDFVILDDKTFTYFEIKSEFDSFARFQEQSRRAHGYFNRFYLVIPECKIKDAEKEIKKAEVYGVCQWGYYVLEDLERGIVEPRKSSYMGHVNISAVADMLWASEKKKLIKERSIKAGINPLVIRHHSETQFEKVTLSRMQAHELDYWFPILFHRTECLGILNKAFSERNWDIFKK